MRMTEYLVLTFVVLAEFVLIEISSSQSQTPPPGQWQAVGPKEQQSTIDFLLADTAFSAGLYAATGAGVYLSSDFGLTWEQPNANIVAGSMQRIVLGDGALYVDVDDRIYTLDGTTLEVVGGLPNRTTGTTIIFLLEFVENTVFVGRLHAIRDNVTYEFFKSNNGKTWQSVGVPFGSQVKVTAVGGIKGVFCASSTAGMFYSADGGSNWREANSPQRVNNYISAGERLYGNTYTGVLVSIDGMSWSEENSKIGGTTLTTVVRLNDGVLYAGTTDHGIFRSQDGGDSWTQASTLNDKYITGIIQYKRDIYACTNGNGAFRSSDNGFTWIPVPSPLQNNPINSLVTLKNLLFAVVGLDRIYRTLDGETWFDLDQDFRRKVMCGIVVSDLNFLMTYDRIGNAYFSKDGGFTWSIIDDSLFVKTQIITIKKLGSTLCVGTGNKGIIISRDGGESWMHAGSPINDNWVGSIFPFDDIAFAEIRGPQSSSRIGAFYSIDNGLTWHITNSPLDSRTLYAMSSLDDIFFAGTDDGLFRSIDGGITWNNSSQGMRGSYVRKLTVLNDTLFANVGMLPQGSELVYRSNDRGSNWIECSRIPFEDVGENFDIMVSSFFSAKNVLYANANIVGKGNTRTPRFYRTYQSFDGGFNWIEVDNLLSEAWLKPVLSLNDTVYIGVYEYSKPSTIFWEQTRFQGLYKSIDGLNWYPLNDGLDKLIGFELAKVDFEQIDKGFLGLNDLVFLPELNRLYAATNQGVFFQTRDTVAPIAFSLRFENSANPFINKQDVSLIIDADGAEYINIAEDQGFTINASGWQPYSLNSMFHLSNGDGSKTIYVRLRDISYNFSNDLQGTIILDTTPPSRPDSLRSQSASGSAAKYMLTWQRATDLVSNLARYRISISQARDFLGVTTVRDSVFASENPSYMTPNLADARWYWRITAIDNAGNESASAIDSFTVNVGQAPTAPTIQLPKPITNDNTPTISWTQIDEAERYRLQYASSSDFQNPITLSGLLVPHFTFIDELPDGVYYIRVYSINASSVESVASPTVQLVIDTQPPINATIEMVPASLFTKSRNALLRLTATGADSVRLLGNIVNSPFQFQLYDLDNQIRTQVSVTLLSQDGPKLLQVQFKDLAGNVANAFLSIFLDTQKPVFPADFPQLSVAIPSVNQAITISLATPIDVNGSGIRSFMLYYRRSGEQWNQVSFQNNLAQIPSPFITNRGVDYQIVADDSAGNPSALSNGHLSFFSIPVSIRAGEAGSSSGLPGGTGGAAYRLISLPLIAENQAVSAIFTELGVYGIDKDYRCWRYDGGNSWREGSDIPVQPGESHFLIRRKSGSVSNQSAGVTAKITDAVLGHIAGWQLRANDWTLVGNPFNFEIPLTDLRLKNRDTSLAFIPDVWSYDGGGLNQGWTKQNLRLSPWGGLAIYNDGAKDTLVIVESLSNTNMTKESLAHIGDTNAIQDKWLVQIRAESNGFQDNENYVGVHESEKDGQGGFDLYEPPLVPGGLSLSFTSQDQVLRRSLARDMRPREEAGHEWTIQLKGIGGSEVKLRFEELTSVPPESEVYLLDSGSQILRDVCRQPEVKVYLPQATRTKILTLLVGDKAFVDEHSDGLSVVPTAFALHQNYPNPFNPTTVIRYELPVEGKVTLKIYNLLGREVMSLSKDELHQPGFYEKVVDLRNLASGIHFYRISVEGEQRFVGTKKMVLAK